MITKYNYTVQDSNNLFADDIPSRELARNELREIKALGYKDAKIVREEFVKISEKVIR